MQITLSPEKRAFVEREIASGGFKSEADAIERALALYERQLRRIRESIEEAEREIANVGGVTLTANEHLARIRSRDAKNR